MIRRVAPQRRIPQRNAGIPHQPPPLRPLKRAASEILPKLFLAHSCQPLQPRQEERFLSHPLAAQRINRSRRSLFIRRENPRTKFHRFCRRRPAVPRTHILANIATEYLPSDRLAQLLRNAPPEFNRQVRYAPPRI